MRPRKILLLFALAAAINSAGYAQVEVETKGPEVAVVIDGKSAPAEVVHATASVLQPLAVVPALGRDFLPSDFQKGAAGVAIISAEFRASTLAAPATIIGRTIRVGDQDFVIVGIAPAQPAALAGRKVWLARQI